MSRRILALPCIPLFCILLFSLSIIRPLLAQQKEAPKQEPAKQEQAPPEEDESLAPKEYSFNPMQADKELRIGNYYFKKGSYRAAAHRFQEATKWNNNFPEAYLRLAEAEEKQKDWKAAREAYNKYLELSPESKNAATIKKKLEKIKN